MSRSWRRILATVGPGLVVMLADSEAGSVIAASQSGARWGYRLLALQFLLIPVLYASQELALRLGLTTGQGLGELIRARLGRGWALLATATLALSCLGALLTQMSGLAGVGQLFGSPPWATIAVTVTVILATVSTGSYRAVERVALALGIAELAFLVVAWRSHPDLGRVLDQVGQQPLAESDYLYLLAANLGTCVMPWTLFYQQAAVIDKGLSTADLKLARIDTLIGAFACQTITAAVLVAAASTLGGHAGGNSLSSVAQIATAFSAALGTSIGHLVFAIGLTGGALLASIVVCLTVAWTLGEITGFHHSLEQRPFEAPWFYGAFALILLAGAAIVASGIDLVGLAIASGVANALLLPIVLLLLWRLGREAPAPEHRLQGTAAAWTALLFTSAAAIGLYAAVRGLLG
jgi:Mn2+/Fe2+ NRAMP family transporter